MAVTGDATAAVADVADVVGAIGAGFTIPAEWEGSVIVAGAERESGLTIHNVSMTVATTTTASPAHCCSGTSDLTPDGDGVASDF